MTTLESNRCYACGKLFCCADCCTDHIRKKHPGRESKCPLCRTERLVVKNFDNQEFLCHVVFHHLPLRCRLCGDNFKNCEDLRCLGNCDRRRLKPSTTTPAIIDIGVKSIKSPETPSSLNKTPCGNFPSKSKVSESANSDYNGNIGNFVSPPELARNTSTPMHVNLAGNGNFLFKTPRSPFKTPKISCHSTKNFRRNERSETNDDKTNETTNFTNANSTNDDSIYHSLSSFSKSTIDDQRTPLRSILTNQSMIREKYRNDVSRNVEKNQNSMQDINEEIVNEIHDNDDMDLTDVMCNVISVDENRDVNPGNPIQRPIREIRDSAKRVRFSDQFEIKTEEEINEDGGFDNSENEEFFEARQSLSDTSLAVVERLSASTALINRENEENLEREETERGATKKCPEITVASVQQNSGQNPSSSSPSSSTVPSSSSLPSSSSSSRVVMMVVVEKSGNVDTSDLAPLIDSGLKKLRSVTAPNANSQSQNPGATTSAGDANGGSGTTVVSVDSYMSVSTVECYSTPNSSVNNSPRSRNSSDSSNSGSGNIFSAVAHAMRSAFRNFAGGNSSKAISREPISPRDSSSIAISSNPDSGASSSSVLTSLAAALVPRTGKRSRDEVFSPQSPSETVDPLNDVRSPVPKRPRGWYKIRAREPIARMRNSPVTSPRGVSSGRQCFQQGSLSVGDTILPLPSRAHQATQTD